MRWYLIFYVLSNTVKIPVNSYDLVLYKEGVVPMENSVSGSCKEAFACRTGEWNVHARLITVFVLIVLLLAGSGYADGFDIVRDGKATTMIVIPDKAVDCVKRAAEELQYYVKEASGATLEIVNESAGAKTEQGCIYLGGCEAAKQAGIVTDKLTRNGFIIKTIGSDLFLAGRDTAYAWTAHDYPAETGTLLAVYNFLDRQMGVRWLWPGKLGEVVPKTSTISIAKLDQTVTLPLISSRFYAYHLGRGVVQSTGSRTIQKR